MEEGPVPQGTGMPVPRGDPVLKPGVVHSHDVGVVEPGGRSSLAEEPLHHPFVGVGLLENLEGHIAIEPGVKRQEDLSETAIPQPFPQLKPPERAERPPAPGGQSVSVRHFPGRTIGVSSSFPRNDELL